MYLIPDRDRQSRFNLDGFKLGQSITFCPSCDWQQEPKTAGPNRCPECRHTPLHVARIMDDTIALVNSTNREKNR